MNSESGETMRRTKKALLKAALALPVLAMLHACGGDATLGGGAPGNGNGNGNGDPDGPSLSRIVLLLSDAQLQSSAVDDDDGVEITAIALDDNNNVVPEIPLSFSTDSGSLRVLDGGITGENGRASAILTTGAAAENRTINLTVSGGGAQQTTSINVVGTRLQVSGPQSVTPGESDTFEIRLVDSAGVGLRDKAVNVTSAAGNAIQPATVMTGPDGRATVEVNAQVAGADTLTFASLGLTAERSLLVSSFRIDFQTPDAESAVELGTPVGIEVRLTENGNPVSLADISFSATRGALSSLTEQTDGDGRASTTLTSQGANGAGPVIISADGPDSIQRKLPIQFFATGPASINVQSEPGTVQFNGESVITARVTDADGNPVRNRTVRFLLNDVSGGQLTVSSAVTDIQGVARTLYIASNSGSASDGVKITAEVGDPVIASDDTSLTVRESALFIVLGSDNLITKNDEDATYDKVYNALITDSAGNPPDQNTVFRLSLRSIEYQKGRYVIEGDSWVRQETVGQGDPFFGTPNANAPPEFGPYFGRGPFGCRSEDPFGTGDINLSDDYNNNGIIDPANVATTPSEAPIDEDGVVSFRVRWPQNYAGWVLVRLSVTASVAGTESRRNLDFVLPAAAEDLNDTDASPPNLFSPFGTEDSCADPN